MALLCGQQQLGRSDPVPPEEPRSDAVHDRVLDISLHFLVPGSLLCHGVRTYLLLAKDPF